MCYGPIELRNAKGVDLEGHSLGDFTVLAAYEEIKVTGLHYRKGNITYIIVFRQNTSFDEATSPPILKIVFPFKANVDKSSVLFIDKLPNALLEELERTLDIVISMEPAWGLSPTSWDGFHNWAPKPLCELYKKSQLEEAIETLRSDISNLYGYENLPFEVLGPDRDEGTGGFFVELRADPNNYLPEGSTFALKIKISGAKSKWARFGQSVTTLMTYSMPTDKEFVATIMHLTRIYMGKYIRLEESQRVLQEQQPFLKKLPSEEKLLSEDEKIGGISNYAQAIFFNVGLGPAQTWDVGWKNVLAYDAFRALFWALNTAWAVLIAVLLR